jgi:excisionase family DNA binding protein
MTPKNPSRDARKRESRVLPRTALPLLSTSEVAAFLGVPVATIYAWRQKGYGPRGIPVGRYVRYRPTDVEEWLRKQEGKAS